MEEIDEILALEDVGAKIKRLKKGRIKDLPDLDAIMNEWDVSRHRTIRDKIYLPDREVTDEKGTVSMQPVNRNALPLQKKIVNTAVSFTFGNPVELHAQVVDGSDDELIYNAVKALSHDCKLKSVNRRMFREVLRSQEAAELWYYITDPGGTNETLGFTTSYKVRVSEFAPFKGDTLYPYFDSTGDMVAFSRQYKRKNENEKEISYFETYTASKSYSWKQDGGQWTVLKEPVANPLGKIPIVYLTQDAVEWADVQIPIERLEYLLSKFAETNDYHASPKIFVQGKIKTFISKGDSGGVIEGEKGSNAQYLYWGNAPEAVRLEIESLIRFIYGLTQTPDISFDSVKGLHQISGEALKLLFMDAHLKVQEKREMLDDYLQRRVNIQKRIVGILSDKKKVADKLQIEPEIIPYMIDDTTTLISNLTAATGGKQIMSQRTAIKSLGWVEDIDEELAQIQKEEDEANTADLFERTI